jgi:protocatechuate 3,4-dioxygenase beta subunit
MPATKTILALSLAAALASCNSGPATAGEHARADLYACEGCEAVYEREAELLGWSAQVADQNEPGERLVAEGTIFAADGTTPQQGVVIYLHQTNAEGLYANGADESEWSRRNGRLRAWVRTGADGRYRFDTIKPAPYPDMTGPAHLHLMVLEPGKRPYYIDDTVFDGEFLVDQRYRARQELRGGSGIVRLSRDATGTLLAQRDIVLERHPE